MAAGAAHKHADAGEVIAVIRRILAENGRDYFWQYAFAGLCLAVVALSTAFMAWIMRDVVDQVFAEQIQKIMSVSLYTSPSPRDA